LPRISIISLDAVGETIPSPIVGSGQTIYGERQQLQRQISTLLE